MTSDDPPGFFSGCELDTAGPVPIYYQLQEWLGERIGDEELVPGMRLPSEREFSDQLGISRMTVRQAVDRLVRQGRLERRRGQGTFVAPPRVTGDLTHLRSASSELQAQGRSSAVTVLDVALATPRSGIRRRLALGGGADTAVRLRRLRRIDGVPSSLETSWLPAYLCEDLLEVDLAARSLNDVLQRDLGLTLAGAKERLTVILLDEFEAAQLQCAVGVPAFLLERTTWDDVGRPVEYVRTVLRGDLYGFETVLDSPAVASLLPEAVLPRTVG